MKDSCYSPELNPVENVWQYLRANWLAISVFETCEAFVEACGTAWNRFAPQARNHRVHHFPTIGSGRCVSGLVSDRATPKPGSFCKCLKSPE